jgi:acyl-coenzyme A synthetase/AMP-(fatty) acid ligase
MTTVFPKMDFTRPGSVNPEEILGPIEKYGVTHMFGSPALLDRVGRYGEARSVRLPTLKRVLSAGAPVSPETLRRFSKLLAGEAEIHTPYGATEALPVCSIAGKEILGDKEVSTVGKGTCVGRPLSGLHVAVIQITDEAIPEWSDDLRVVPGEIGELVVWGPNVSSEYFELPKANELAKIRDDQGSVRHRMGDLGFLDSKGRVWFCGRKTHRLITSSGTLFTIPCEGVFNQHPAVRRAALVGLGAPPRQRPVICVELEERQRRSEHLKQEILALGASFDHTRQIKTLLFHPAFPVDIRHNAKISREKLAVWARGKLT